VSCLVKKLWFSKLFNMYIVCMFLPFVVNKDEYNSAIDSSNFSANSTENRVKIGPEIAKILA